MSELISTDSMISADDKKWTKQKQKPAWQRK